MEEETKKNISPEPEPSDLLEPEPTEPKKKGVLKKETGELVKGFVKKLVGFVKDFAGKIKKKDKRSILILAGILAAIVIISVGFYFYGGDKSDKETEPDAHQFTGEAKKVAAENMEITLFKTEEDSYPTFEEVGGKMQRTDKKYYKAYAKVFNPDTKETITFSSIKLVDDLGNEYSPNTRILFDLRGAPEGFKEFGRDMNIYPRVIREGYIVFPAVAEEAKKLRLIFKTTTDKEIAFEFNK